VPSYLTGDLAGDYGYDPLSLGSDPAQVCRCTRSPNALRPLSALRPPRPGSSTSSTPGGRQRGQANDPNDQGVV
jgi:hypothetical protein